MDKEIAEVVARSKLLNSKRRMRESEDLMRAAIRKHPLDPEVLLQAAATFLLTAPAGTAALAHRAVQTSPDDPGVLFRAAHLLFAADEFEASSEYLARVEPLLTPEFPLLNDVIHLAGKHAFHRGAFEEAERALVTAFERDPEGNGHGEVLAKLYKQQGKPQEALEVVRRARVYRPDDGRLGELERALTSARPEQS